MPRPVSAIRWLPVWQRNLLLWRKLAYPSLISNLGEPVLYLLGLGYGLGALLGEVGGMPYRVYLASGFICSSAMMTASFEAMYSAYTRMTVQQTWDAMVSTPLEVHDVVVGEIAWAATKSLFSAMGVFTVAALLGAIDGWPAVWVPLAVILSGLCFASLAMVVTALARSYDFFLFYTTLCITPMFLLSGVFFPLQQMPPPMQAIAQALPLTHAVALVRPLATGLVLEQAWVHVAVLVAFTTGAASLSVHLVRRRLIV